MTTFDNLESFFLEDNENDTKEEVEAELRSYGVEAELRFMLV